MVVMDFLCYRGHQMIEYLDFCLIEADNNGDKQILELLEIMLELEMIFQCQSKNNLFKGDYCE